VIKDNIEEINLFLKTKLNEKSHFMFSNTVKNSLSLVKRNTLRILAMAMEYLLELYEE
jgi:hypothetical protein